MTIGQTSTGHIINLASNDVQRFDKVQSSSVIVVVFVWDLRAYLLNVYQPGALRAPGWSCSYFAIFTSVCLFVHLSQQSGEAWERVIVAPDRYGCLS